MYKYTFHGYGRELVAQPHHCAVHMPASASTNEIDCSHYAERTSAQHSSDIRDDRSGPVQRFTWKIVGMDCPGCAQKIETAVPQLPDIVQVRVIFATEKLVVESHKNVRQAVENGVSRVGYRLISPTVPPAEMQRGFWHENGLLFTLGTLMLTSWLVSQFTPRSGESLFIITTLVGMVSPARSAWHSLRQGVPFVIETLMTIAAAGALLLGATAEAAMVLLLFMVGERLEAFAAGRARKGVTALMALKPELAVRLRGEVRETVGLTIYVPAM